MANIPVQARVSHELKEQADAIFSAIGLSTSDAIRVFLQQSVNVGGLPFQPIAKPLEDTRKAYYAHELDDEAMDALDATLQELQADIDSQSPS